MKIAGIIAEYNPFHNGHAYQIRATREAGATQIVCVMSGNCVQRGDIAITDKHFRARTAVKNGADLVIELPMPYSLGTAPDFARAGVNILDRLGCVNMLSFGSECGDVNKLIFAANAIDSLSDKDIKQKMSEGMTYPSAIASLVGDDCSEILNGANNTLAIEYIRALRGTNIEPFTVKRTSAHDSSEAIGEFTSASHIRELLLSGDDALRFMPEAIPAQMISSVKKVEEAILYRLAMMTKDDFADVPYADGLEARLYDASRTASTLEALYDSVKTKNITHARVRRAVMLAALGVQKSDFCAIPYARVLAMNDRGAEILALCKKTATIPISASLAELSKLGDFAARFAVLDERSSRLRALAAAEREHLSEFSRKFEIVT